MAIMFGLERFHQYTCSTKVTVQNDHKPLASILRKPLSETPKRLQALMMRLYRYDFDLCYLESNKLVIAGTLSRAYLDIPESEVRVINVEDEDVPDKILGEVKDATATDKSMQKFLTTIKQGWPKEKDNAPS
jgi:hypothetical protein